MLGTMDAKRIDTTPGAQSVFAAPADCKTDKEYNAALKAVWEGAGRQSFNFSISLYMRDHRDLEFVGPFAESAKEVLAGLSRKRSKEFRRQEKIQKNTPASYSIL
jgi:hypothetical protein